MMNKQELEAGQSNKRFGENDGNVVVIKIAAGAISELSDRYADEAYSVLRLVMLLKAFETTSVSWLEDKSLLKHFTTFEKW